MRHICRQHMQSCKQKKIQRDNAKSATHQQPSQAVQQAV